MNKPVVKVRSGKPSLALRLIDHNFYNVGGLKRNDTNLCKRTHVDSLCDTAHLKKLDCVGSHCLHEIQTLQSGER